MDQSVVSSLPINSGVYLFKDGNGKVLYVGKAKNLRSRVSSYFSKNGLAAKTIRLLEEAKSIDHIIVGSEIEAFLLEAELIKKYKPFFNIKLSDDKFFPYIKITKEDIPVVSITRKKDDPKAEYYGPYPDVKSVKSVLRMLRRIFPYQSVKIHPKKKCFYNHLHLCPCVPAVEENRDEYKKNIQALKKFLKGNKNSVIKMLEREQKKLVDLELFEKAGEIQKQIEQIHRVTDEHYSPFAYVEKPDFYYERIQKEVEALSQALRDEGLPVGELKRIECYDISNFQGKQATGSMVVFTNGDADKKEYRKFKIRTKSTPDDFTMMKEVLSRRFRRDGWENPDLIVIDGGKGQVSASLQALASLGKTFPLIGLAKREETIVLPQKNAGRMEFLEIKLPLSHPGINLLRRIRDEAHRFAITYHRLLRKKSYDLTF